MFLASATTPVLNHQVKAKNDASSCTEQRDDVDQDSTSTTVGTNLSDDESLTSCDVEEEDEYKIIPVFDPPSRKVISSSDSRKVELLLDNMEGFEEMLKNYQAGDLEVDSDDEEDEDEDDSSFSVEQSIQIAI